jgi:hypothetical protein
MKRTVNEKIYIIFNLAAQKQYVGKTRNLDWRYSAHVSKLRSGKHDIPDLQRDWDRDGEENFIWVDVLLRAGQMRANILEDLLIDTLRSTDPTLGYNRMTSRGWSSYARLRDLERKLIRRGKFKLIAGVKLDDPIAEVYLESVWKGHGKKKRERPEWEESEDQRDALEEHEQEGEALEGPDECEEEDGELRDGEDGEGWEEEERRAGEEREE